MISPHSSAADRNKQPILDLLRTVLPTHGTALKIASGTAQHITWFAAALPQLTWQPTEVDAGLLPALAERIAQEGFANVRPPVLLDVAAPCWPAQGAEFAQRFDAVFCANTRTPSAWPRCASLASGRPSAPSSSRCCRTRRG